MTCGKCTLGPPGCRAGRRGETAPSLQLSIGAKENECRSQSGFTSDEVPIVDIALMVTSQHHTWADGTDLRQRSIC